MKILFVGDTHATPEELGDCQNLFLLIEKAALSMGVDSICFLGDQYHTHQVIRAEVMHFYRQWFRRLRTTFRVMALVGNHDYAGEGNTIHSMEIHEEQVEVVDEPLLVRGVLFMPYYADRVKFLEDARHHGGRTLVCHQTFHGATYENGFLAEDGVDATTLGQYQILSGHIHAPQTFGRITYIGAPRWRILTDANVDRAIWVYEFDDDGDVVSKKSIDTGTICRKIHHYVLTPSALNILPSDLDPKDEWRIDVEGPKDFIEEWESQLRFRGAKVRTFCTDRPTSKISEAEGVGPAFRKFLNGFTVRHGTPKEDLLTMAQKRLHV